MPLIEKKINHAVCMINKIILPFNPSSEICSLLRNSKKEYATGEVKWTCEFINFCIEQISKHEKKTEEYKDLLPTKLVICASGDEYETEDNDIIIELASEYISDCELHSGSEILFQKNKIKVESGFRTMVIFKYV